MARGFSSMNPAPVLQVIGNVCAGLATMVLFWPLQRVLHSYASKFPSDDRWVTPVLYALLPLWMLLMVGLLCVTASGGFDWLRLGRMVTFALAAAATIALAVVTFVFVALYIRPGFTPRFLYVPGVYLVPLVTALIVVLSLSPRFAASELARWLRLPWAVFSAVSLVLCLGFFGYRLVNHGMGVQNLVRHVLNSRESSPDHLARIASLDPQSDNGFAELLKYVHGYHESGTREEAIDRLRANPEYLNKLAMMLEHGRGNANSDALEFLDGATLTEAERDRLALPARTALERFIGDIPAPNYMSPDRRKQLLRWGRKALPGIISKFYGTKVDFSLIMPEFEHALRPDESRR